MEETNEISTALDDFNRNENSEITTTLDGLISRISTTGLTLFPWHRLKKLMARKLDIVITEFQTRTPVAAQTVGGVNTDNVAYDEMKLRLVESIEKFNGAPFTIQRLCELMMNPTKHYKKTEKFMRGIEKNLLVVSTVDPLGNKIVSDPRVAREAEPSADRTADSDDGRFLAPSLPAISESSPATSQSSASSRLSSSFWFGTGRAPSVFDSPSVRGSSTASGVRRGSPYPTGSSMNKRRRTDSDEGDDESEDKRQKEMSPTSEEVQPSCAPLLGRLLSDSEDDATAGRHGDGGDEKLKLGDIMDDDVVGNGASIPAEEINDKEDATSSESVAGSDSSEHRECDLSTDSDHVTVQPLPESSDDQMIHIPVEQLENTPTSAVSQPMDCTDDDPQDRSSEVRNKHTAESMEEGTMSGPQLAAGDSPTLQSLSVIPTSNETTVEQPVDHAGDKLHQSDIPMSEETATKQPATGDSVKTSDSVALKSEEVSTAQPAVIGDGVKLSESEIPMSGINMPEEQPVGDDAKLLLSESDIPMSSE